MKLIIIIIGTIVTAVIITILIGLNKKPYAEIRIGKASCSVYGFEFSYEDTRTGNVGITEFHEIDGNVMTRGSQGSPASNIFEYIIGNYQISKGGASRSVKEDEILQFELKIKAGDVIRLKADDELDIIRYVDANKAKHRVFVKVVSDY